MRWTLLALALLATPTAAHEGLDQRIGALDLQILVDPTAPAPRLERARLLRDAERLDAAAAALDEVTALDRDHPGLLLERGLLAIAQGRDPRPWLDRHLDHPRARAEGFDARAALLETTGHPLAEVRDRQDAWIRAPSPDRALALSRALERAGDGACAAALLGEADRLLSGAIVLKIERVRVLLRARRAADALAAASALVDDAPTNPDHLLLRAEARGLLGDTDGAHADRRRAVQLAEERLAARPTELARAGLQRARASLAAP